MRIKWKVKLYAIILKGNTKFYPSLSSRRASRSISLNLRSPGWPSSSYRTAPRRVASRHGNFFRQKSSLSAVFIPATAFSPLFAYPFRDRRRRHEGFLDPPDATRRDVARCGAERSGAWEGIEARAKGVFPPCARSRSMGSPWRQTSPYLYSPRYFPVKLPELPASCCPCAARRSQGPRSFHPSPKVGGLS